MRDRDDIPVETSDGDRGGGGMGDRLVVGLAALALLGGALILAGKGLGGEKGSASASGSPSGGPSASEPAPTAAASPTPAALTVQDRALPSQEPERPTPFNGWIRLNQDLPVYDNPSTGATRISALANGTLAYAEEPPDQVPGGIYWLQIDVPSPSGFIVAGLGGKLSVQRYQQGQTAYGGSVAGLAAGPQGFVAWGSTSSRANQVSRPLLATSRDGRTWTDVGAATLRGDSWIRAVAYGPAGWLALASVGSTAQTLWLWASTDGRSWRIVGALPVDASDSEPKLIGSGAGYLLTLTGYRSSDSAAKSWHSVDGASWTQGELPAGAAAAPRLVVGTRSGYYSWPDAYNPGPNKEAAYSPDGASWVAVEPPPTLGGGRVVALGDGLLAVGSSPVTGAPRVWRGLFTNGGVTWTSQATSLPRTFGFGSLASNGSSAILFGWDRSTVAIQAWSFSGGAWTPVILPAGAFGGTVPVVAAGSPVGFVAVGSQLNLRADNPVLWSGTERGALADHSAHRRAYGSSLPPAAKRSRCLRIARRRDRGDLLWEQSYHVSCVPGDVRGMHGAEQRRLPARVARGSGPEPALPVARQERGHVVVRRSPRQQPSGRSGLAQPLGRGDRSLRRPGLGAVPLAARSALVGGAQLGPGDDQQLPAAVRRDADPRRQRPLGDRRSLRSRASPRSAP